MVNNERILYKKAKPSESILEQTANPNINATNSKKNNQGVLVIDPNKVVNDNNDIVVKYGRTENLELRTSQHNNDYGKMENVELRLKLY